MNKLIVVFVIAGLMSILTAACQHAEEEFRSEFNCHVSGIDCPSVNMDDPNLRGSDGTNGADGRDGAAGPAGERGLPGPGEAFTTVRFCAQPSVYPTLFAEYGVCISGHLYAVYSIPNAFLTLIPPGRYSSTGINSTCSFTVLANCVVVP